jgi:hypothetical protein
MAVSPTIERQTSQMAYMQQWSEAHNTMPAFKYTTSGSPVAVRIACSAISKLGAGCGAQNDRPEASRLTIAGLDPLLRLGLVGGAGGSLSGLGDFGGVQAEGAADRGESLPAAAAAGAAAQAPATAVTQRRPALLDHCQPMVWWLAWFAPHCETRDGVEVASSGLACLLVVAVTSAAGEGWSSPDFPRTSGTHPTDDHRKSALGSKADPS